MKLKSLILICLATVISVFAGCTKDLWNEPMLSVSKPVDDGTITFTSKGGKETLKMVCTRDWEFQDVPSWISVTPESGSASTAQFDVTIEVPENIGKDRQAKITIKSATEKEYVTIYQIGPEGEDDGVIDATVAEVIEAADPEQCYRLTGKVSGFNASYCSFDITDATGKIYVYSVTAESKNAYASKINNGDTVTIEGYYEFYAAKSQHEIKNAKIVDWKEGSDEPSGEAVTATVAEVLAAKNETQLYRLTGTVSGFNSQYCSFDLKDATGKIYVYSVTNATKNEYASKLSNGDTVTIEGYYSFYAQKSQDEIVSAKIVEWKQGGGGEAVDATVSTVISEGDESKVYRLTGTVSGFNPTYCSFDIKDATGKIYVYSVTAATKAEYSSKLSNGDTVTIEGYYLFYTQKSQHEIINATITSWTPGGQTGGDAKDATVAEIISARNEDQLYRITGTVSGFNPTYCSFDITDATGKIYVYSVTAATKAEYSSKLSNGDTVTIEGYYMFYTQKSQHEIVNATITAWTTGGGQTGGDAKDATVAEIISTQNENQLYRITGTVSGFNPTYCSFDITDATGKIYVYSVTAATKAEYASKLGNGDTVTIEGYYSFYSQKSQHEIINATITSWTSGGGDPQPPVTAVDATVSTVISEASTTKCYRLTGSVSGFNPTYCSFDLTDATGKIYVYSVTAATKAEYASKLGNGDTVTIEGYYQYYEKTSQHEIINATITSWTDGEAPAVALTHPLTSALSWTLGNKGTDVKAIIGGTTYNALKLGTSSVVGEATIKVPAGSKAVHFYAVGWKGIDGKIKISGGGIDQTVTAIKDSGAANNSPFTLIDISDANYITVSFPAPLATDTTLELSTLKDGIRAIILGVNAE